MDDTYIESILAECDNEHYPEDFLNEYEAIECLAHNDSGTTLLVKNKKTGKHFVAKCYTNKTLLSHITEADILKKLNHPGLPQYAGEYQSGMLCVVREYVKGTPLDQYAAHKEITEAQAVSIIISLCDILTYLHGQTPPVIHRDIKPQNLIIDKKGHLRLIDFGISRVYDENAKEDTVCYGTKYFAPPEQYGFAQTDCRADIFSLGVLLGWLLTGESELARSLERIKNKRLLRIVKRCTAFAPDRRFQSSERVRRALQNADGHRQKRIIRWICGVFACAACLCLGFALGRYTDVTPTFARSSGVVFQEPIIEQAVRLALQKDANEPIEYNDLLSVTELYIYGDRAIGSSEEFDELGEHMALNDGVLKNGAITSLSDLAQLKNLKIVRIALEDITDLSPLTGLQALELVDFRHEPIEDISPLASLPALRDVCLFETRVSDLSPFASCVMLERVDLGKTRITSLSAFQNMGSLKRLTAMDTPLQTLSGIESLTHLETFSMSDVADGNLRPLLALPKLKEVTFDKLLTQAAKDQLKDAVFLINYSS